VMKGYYPANVSENTIIGDVARISLDAGSSVSLQMMFLDRITRILSEPGMYAFTFMNFATLTVTGCQSYDLSANTLVEVTQDGRNTFTFKSTAELVDARHALHMSDDEKAGAVMVRCKQPVISMDVVMQQGYDAGIFLIAGASNVACPFQDTCGLFECPEYFSNRAGKPDLYCEADVCHEEKDRQACCVDSVPTLCESKNTLMFPPNSVAHSNLGGKGPDHQAQEGIRYMNVFPDSNETIDMIIHAVGDYLSTDSAGHNEDPKICDTANNGMHGKYGVVTVSSGSVVRLKVTFVNPRKNKEVSLSTGFFFTVYDFDNEKAGGGVETVKISGYTKYSVSNTTTVVVENEGGLKSFGVFKSGAYGTEQDNPKNPRQLSEAEADKSVTFTFPPGTPGFLMELSVSPGFSARNFEFTGYSMLPCPPQGMCSSMVCPAGYEYKDDPDKILCADHECTHAADRDTCCQQFDTSVASCQSMICPIDFELKQNAQSLKCATAVCTDLDLDTCCAPAQTFSTMCSPDSQLVLSSAKPVPGLRPNALYVRFDNVFPYSNETIDMEATIIGLGAHGGPSSETNPTIMGQLAKLMLPNSSTTVSLSFRFFDQKTGEAPIKMPRYFITVIGGSKSSTHIHRQMNVTGDGLLQATVSEDTSVIIDANQVFLLASLEGSDEGKLDSANIFALAKKAKDSAVALLLNSSSFQIDFSMINAHTEPVSNKFAWGVQAGGQDASSMVDAATPLYFGGASDLTCQTRKTCASFQCPSGFNLRENAEQFACKGEACTIDDYPTCCDCDATASFLMDPSMLVQSTLGHRFESERSMFIKNVFPNWKPNAVNLRIRAIGDYFPSNESSNKLMDQFLVINVRTSSSATFHFEFVDDQNEPVRLPFNFIFSVFDLDQQRDGGGQEHVSVSSYDWFVLSNQTTLETDTEEDGNLFFHSTSYGNVWDNPENPLALTDEHLYSSVSFMMRDNLAKFNVSITVGDGFRGRNVIFAGQSNLVCSKREVCSNYKCPKGKALVNHASWHRCLDESCTTRDESRCCKDAVFDDVPSVGNALFRKDARELE